MTHTPASSRTYETGVDLGLPVRWPVQESSRNHRLNGQCSGDANRNRTTGLRTTSSLPNQLPLSAGVSTLPTRLRPTPSAFDHATYSRTAMASGAPRPIAWRWALEAAHGPGLHVVERVVAFRQSEPAETAPGRRAQHRPSQVEQALIKWMRAYRAPPWHRLTLPAAAPTGTTCTAPHPRVLEPAAPMGRVLHASVYVYSGT